MEDKIDIQKLSQKLAEFEIYRIEKAKKLKRFKRISKFLYFIIVPCGILGIIGIVLTFLFIVLWPFLLIAIGLLILNSVIYNKIFKDPEGQFYTKFKNEIVKPAIEEYNPTFKYSVNKSVGLETVEKSWLFNYIIKGYYGEDHVKGKINGVDIEFSEIILKAEDYRRLNTKSVAKLLLDGDLSREIITAFRGVFFVIDFHKKFKGTHVVVSKRKKFPSSLFKQNHTNFNKVEMDHAEFNKHFNFFTTSEATSYYILSPLLMENLIALNKRNSIYASFISGEMYLAIEMQKDLFECDINKGIPDIESFKELFNEINLIEKVMKHLKQDVRIWGK